MSVLAHVKVTPSTIAQLSNRPIMMALLDQCVNYYYSNWPLGLKGYKMREMEEKGLGSFTSCDRTRSYSKNEGENVKGLSDTELENGKMTTEHG